MSDKKLDQYIADEQFYKAVVEDGSDIIFIVDYEGSIKYHNPAVEENLGYKPKSLIGKNFFDYIHPDSKKELRQTIHLSTHKEFDESVEFHFLCKDGSYRYLEFNSINLRHREGVTGLILDCRDITQRKKDAQELLRAQKAKEQFLANMSHEIRTPINGISGMASLMAEAKDDEERQSYLEAIRKSSESLKVIINDILDLSIIESGKLRFEKIGFSIKKQLLTVYNTFIHQAKSKNLDLSVEVDPEADIVVIGDPVRLNQILINLISNALKFTHVGRVDVTARVIRKEGNTIFIGFEVIDTGIGIPDEKVKNIFESFTQADESVTRRYGGTGLGLTITRQLVDLQEGEIKVKSVENKGSTFTCIIPYKFGSEEDLEEFRTPAQERLKPFLDTRVLVVEDNDINRLYASKLMEKWNVQTEHAQNGVVAIEKLSNQTFDLILMDLQMPVMDGFEATLVIRNRFEAPKNNTPIIALTANAIKGDNERCFKVGMNDYLSKPFKPEELYAMMKKYIPNKRVDVLDGSDNMTTTGGQVAITDLSYLNEVCHGDKGFIIEMIDVFINTIPASFDEMKKDIRNQDWKSLATHAHKVKPSFTFMGLQDAVKIIKSIERGVDNNSINVSEFTVSFQQLNKISIQAIAELKEHKQSLI